MNDQLTIRQIAEHLGEPVYRIAYAIRRSQIQPAFRAGNCFVFPAESIEAVKESLAKTRKYGTTGNESAANAA